jgi:MarR family
VGERDLVSAPPAVRRERGGTCVRRFDRGDFELQHDLVADPDVGLSLADYEVLVHLTDAPAGRLRPFELQRGLQWEQSRLSHHLTRIQHRGLVVRDAPTTDAEPLSCSPTPADAPSKQPCPAMSTPSGVYSSTVSPPDQIAMLRQVSTQVIDRLRST